MTDQKVPPLYGRSCVDFGAAIAEVLPPLDHAEHAPLPPRLEAAWRKQRPRRRSRIGRRPLWTLAVLPAAAAAWLFLIPERGAVRYRVEGAAVDRDGRIEPPSTSAATLRFSEGTTVALTPGAAVRVKSRRSTGATIELERGRASLAVVHRPRADWHVAIGPFDVSVTGTSFDVETSDPREGFEIAMKIGAVVVRGPLTGGGVELRAGQRLVASLSRRTLVIRDQESAAPKPPVRAAAPTSVARLPTADAQSGGRMAAPLSRRKRSVATGAMVGGTGRPAAVTRETPIGASTAASLQTDPAQPPSAAPPAPQSVTPPAPSPPRVSLLQAGGTTCAAGDAPQLTFDRADETAVAGRSSAAALSAPRSDRTRSWCGAGSLRFTVDFGGREASNARPESGRQFQAGEAIIRLPTLVDLRGKTVVLHAFVEGPPDATFDVRILGETVGIRMGHDVTRGLRTGRWLTIRSHYPPANAAYDPHLSVEPTGIQNLIVRLDATGSSRTWTGALYLDDVSWH